jgi:hypothetical protein
VRFGARDYDPFSGRWTLKDPIRFEGNDTNIYAYVGNNPAIRYDAFGLAYYPEWSPFNGDVVNNSGEQLDAWIIDLPNEIRGECGDVPIPKNADIDFIQFNGTWYKIKGGTATISKNGNVTGPATYKINEKPWWNIFDDGYSEYKNYINERGPKGCGCEQ